MLRLPLSVWDVVLYQEVNSHVQNKTKLIYETKVSLIHISVITVVDG